MSEKLEQELAMANAQVDKLQQKVEELKAEAEARDAAAQDVMRSIIATGVVIMVA